jgi:hypothetical protein
MARVPELVRDANSAGTLDGNRKKLQLLSTKEKIYIRKQILKIGCCT